MNSIERQPAVLSVITACDKQVLKAKRDLPKPNGTFVMVFTAITENNNSEKALRRELCVMILFFVCIRS